MPEAPAMPTLPAPRLLQGLNVLMAFACLECLKLGTAAWTAAHWSPLAIGIPPTLASVAYALTVGPGGRGADRFGRARTSAFGALVGALGVAIPLAWPTPLTSAIAVVVCFGGAGWFYPGIAGLFSDSASARHLDDAPLHRRVSQYNLGWSTGTFLGMCAPIVLDSAPLRAAFGAALPHLGFALAMLGLLLIVALLRPYRHLPALAHAEQAAQASDPAIPGLTLMHRVALLMLCVFGFALFDQLDVALAERMGSAAAASERAAEALAGYCAGYTAMFFVLGRWGGWILRPWRLWWLQCAVLCGPAALMWCAASGGGSTAWVIVGAAFTGIGYGATFTGSIYYSLRVPHGVSRSSGIHERFLGVGNTIGPILAGSWAMLLASHGISHLTALAAFGMCITSAVLMAQAVAIPRILSRATAAPAPAAPPRAPSASHAA
jgi:MFS family permease